MLSSMVLAGVLGYLPGVSAAQVVQITLAWDPVRSPNVGDICSVLWSCQPELYKQCRCWRSDSIYLDGPLRRVMIYYFCRCRLRHEPNDQKRFLQQKSTTQLGLLPQMPVWRARHTRFLREQDRLDPGLGLPGGRGGNPDRWRAGLRRPTAPHGRHGRHLCWRRRQQVWLHLQLERVRRR